MVLIHEVIKNSYADRAGLKAKDTLVSVNGYEINDVLDYRYRTCTKLLDIKYLCEGKPCSAKIIKGEYDDLGLEFDTYLMDEKQTCSNRCIFCFIDQNPKGMRESIYFKDDDSRLSFLMGNYVTLTNMTDKDIDRIIEMKMSPVNISVHTMNPELRVKMMRNKNAGKVLSYIDRLADAGIALNFQIVLCKGINDGLELEHSMREMEKYHEVLVGVSVVPSGLTDHREKLYPLEMLTCEDCLNVIKTVDGYGEGCKDKYGKRIFFCADEFYLKAGVPVPDGDYYEGYPQIEDGVGQIRSMSDEIDHELEDIAMYSPEAPRELSIATGEAAYSTILEAVKKLQIVSPKLKCHVYPVKNKFFGKNITVAGLLTGKDIFEQLSGKQLGSRLLVPEAAVRREGRVFLDDMSADELSEKLGVPIYAVTNDGYDFVSNVMYKI